jgi:hypothetical protein
MINVLSWWNTECMKCGTVEKEMVKVGALVFCKKCFVSEFKNADPVDRDKNSVRSKTYDKWLRKIWGIKTILLKEKKK